MPTRLTREQLYALVWDRPMTKLAKEFHLSDVALHKICRKHNVPTPPLGYWAKKAHGKPVKTTPLPKDQGPSRHYEIVIHHGAASDETEAMARARAQVSTALEQVAERQGPPIVNPILERTLAKLGMAKPDRSGIARLEGKGLIRVAVRPESAERAQRVLNLLVSGAEAAGIRLEPGEDGAAFCANGETVSVELVEATDKVEHVATDAELRAVTKWEAECEAYRRRTGHLRDWGQPHIPKWEERFQGRLIVRLEEVRIRTDNAYWGPLIPRTFADSKTRDVARMVPKIVSTIAAIAVAKRDNRAADERRRLAEEEAARRRAEAERRAALERQRLAVLGPLLDQHEETQRLRAWLTAIDSRGTSELPPRVTRLVHWAQARLEAMERAGAPAAVEARLERERLFGDDED